LLALKHSARGTFFGGKVNLTPHRWEASGRKIIWQGA